ncbi:hypothetical protein [Mucilaginibacter sp. L3T2-6]|uniref:hypothetical protein n=1 Tax=Mucilaginibacter sp. L3T2-6 TaxID=3062491 RepID=UPI002675D4FE|nr:hypothetical protein [Mucilaginibacter sp. L3T2-6]MDO3641758.1 hypothetical protein [Mucilaginibacter sp. L3T2-6]MDV6214252.1 hypothetical protein [Mucilaginibacter sp. L3T2-6]
MKTINIIKIVPVLALAFAACKKPENQTGPNAGGGVKSGTENPLAASACGATKADAENITIFPADNAWHQDVSKAAVDPYCTKIIAQFATSPVHPDFGSGKIDGATFGFPFAVVCGSQPKVRVKYRANAIDGNFGDESDSGPFPIPLTAPVEQSGDGHVIVVDKDNDMLYELYNANVKGDHWEASSGAKFNLNSNALRPDGWTSADAAGLPIFAGLVRYDEVLKGVINHAIRFTLPKADILSNSHILPARHGVPASGKVHAALPFGARLRLKAGFNISGYPPHIQTILTAFKKYGIILADVGSAMFISGSQDDRWNNNELNQLKKLKGSDFEVIRFN